MILTTLISSQISKLEYQIENQVEVHHTSQESAKEEAHQVMTQLNNKTHHQIMELQTTVGNMEVSRESDQRRLQEHLRREIDGAENRLSQKQVKYVSCSFFITEMCPLIDASFDMTPGGHSH